MLYLSGLCYLQSTQHTLEFPNHVPAFIGFSVKPVFSSKIPKCRTLHCLLFIKLQWQKIYISKYNFYEAALKEIPGRNTVLDKRVFETTVNIFTDHVDKGIDY